MNKLVRRTKLFVGRNGSTILTCFAGVGLVATAVLTAQATPKAMTRVENAKAEKGEDLTKLQTVVAAAPAYIPPILTGVATIACMFGANALNKRQQASLMSAYALLDNSYKEYKKKVGDLYGEDADRKVKEEIAKDKFAESELTPANGMKLFYDDFSGRIFESTTEKVLDAEYNINRDLSMQGYATLNDFYNYLGLVPIDGGDELGWSSGMNFDYYWQEWIDFGHYETTMGKIGFNHQKTTMGDDLECVMIVMFNEPTLGWEDY
jgi:hypothetical protein